MLRELDHREIDEVSGGDGEGELITVTATSTSTWATSYFANMYNNYTQNSYYLAAIAGMYGSGMGATGSGSIATVPIGSQDADNDGTLNANDPDYDAPDAYLGDYQDENGIYSVYQDPLTGQFTDIKISDEGGTGGWAPISNSGSYFGSVSTGYLGLIGGLSLTTNPLDIGLFAGVGDPGISTSIGYASDATAFLNGPAISLTAGAGLTVNAETGEVLAVQVGDPSASITYGISALEAYRIYRESQGLSVISNGFYNQYIGPYMHPLDYPEEQ